MQSTLKIDPKVMELLKARTPSCASLTSIANLLLLSALESETPLIKLGKPSSSLSSLREREVLPSKSLEEEERVRALSLEGLPIPPAAADKVIDPALEAHSLLIRDFWKTKKGSKGERAWQILQSGLKAIQEKYGDNVVHEQLEQGISARWNGITLKNYEQYEAKRSHRPGQTSGRSFTDADYAAMDAIRTPW